ncbi:MAG TPA: lysophospholipase [Longimicrobium sp.]|nr:lysophospholipase [Longimicrobium sp.]
MPIRELAGELRAGDGVRLHHVSWIPDGAPPAVVLVSHGHGEHGGRYAELARHLAERGMTVHAIDHRGHGKSGGPRGHVDRFADYVRDLETWRRAVTADVPATVPVFLLGHSLGGLIAIRYLQAHPEAGFRGAILSAPLLGIAVEAPRWKVALSGVFSRVLPRLPFSNELDPSMLSTAPGYVEAYRADKLLHPTITPRLFTEIGAAMRAAFEQPDSIRIPLLVLAPTGDRVVAPEAVARFASACPGDVEVRRYEGFMHEALNETERHRVMDDVSAWLDARIAG